MLLGKELKGIILTKHVSRIEEMRIVGAYLKKSNGKSHLEDIFVDVIAIVKHVLYTQLLGCEIWGSLGVFAEDYIFVAYQSQHQ